MTNINRKFIFQKLTSQKVLTTILLSFSTLHAENILIDAEGRHILENQTVDSIDVKNVGTIAEIRNVTVNGKVWTYYGATTEIFNSKIDSSIGSDVGLHIQGTNTAGTSSTVIGDTLKIFSASDGIVSSGGAANINLNNLEIKADLMGLQLNGSLTGNGVGINTTRLNSFDITSGRFGVYATFGAEVYLTDGTITVSSDNEAGIYLGGVNKDGLLTTAHLDNVTVHTTGNATHGLHSQQFTGGGANSYWDNSHIITEGNGSFGVLGDYSNNLIEFSNNSTVTTYGDKAYGVYSRGGAKVILDNSHIITKGENAAGIYSWRLGNSYLNNGSSVTTTGQEAHGAMVQYAGNINVDGSSIHTQGIDAHGIYMVAGVAENAGNRYISNIALKNSTILSDQGYGIATAGGALDLRLDNSTLAGGKGFMNVQDYAGSGTPAWDQGITTVNLLVDNHSRIEGTVGVASTTVANITLQGNSVWTIDGDSTLTNLTNRNSTIQFIPDGITRSIGDKFNTLTVRGNYIGDNGLIIFNTILNDDDSQSDKLVIEGDASGQTSVQIINRGGIGAPTQEGILLVKVMGSSSPEAFSLKSDYIAANGKPTIVMGVYGYSLYQGSIIDPDDDNWYLRSSLDTDNGSGNILYQPGIPLYESYSNVLYSLNSISTLRDRVGERKFDTTVTENGDISSYYGVWSRIRSSHNHFEPNQTITNANQNIDTWQMQIGADMLAYSGETGHLVLGISTHYGHAKANITSIYGNGKIDTQNYGIGSTLTWYSDNGFYMDAQAQANWFESDIRSYTLGWTEVSDNKGFGYALGLEVGHSFAVNKNWAVTPQAQIIYSNIDYDSFLDATSMLVSQQKKGRTSGRLGLSIDYRDQTAKGDGLRAYSTINLYQNFTGNSGVNVNGASFSQRNERTWAGVGAGATYSWENGKYSVYGEADVKTSLRRFGKNYGVTASIGFRIKI